MWRNLFVFGFTGGVMSIEKGIEELVALNKPTPIGISYLVEPRLLKDGNPYWDAKIGWSLEKLGDLVGFTGGSYESSVNNQRLREQSKSDFESKPLWNGKGEHVNKFLVRHKETGKLYLKVMPATQKLDDDLYTVRSTVQYRHKNHKPVSMKELEQILTFEKERSVAEQGTQKPIYWNTIMVDNILQLRFNKKVFTR
jgi:hypothetical protein